MKAVVAENEDVRVIQLTSPLELCHEIFDLQSIFLSHPFIDRFLFQDERDDAKVDQVLPVNPRVALGDQQSQAQEAGSPQ